MNRKNKKQIINFQLYSQSASLSIYLSDLSMVNFLLWKTVFLMVWCLLFAAVNAGKFRSWLGPTNFEEGEPPLERNSMGFTSYGEILYVFSGYLQNGKICLRTRC